MEKLLNALKESKLISGFEWDNNGENCEFWLRRGYATKDGAHEFSSRNLSEGYNLLQSVVPCKCGICTNYVVLTDIARSPMPWGNFNDCLIGLN